MEIMDQAESLNREREAIGARFAARAGVLAFVAALIGFGWGGIPAAGGAAGGALIAGIYAATYVRSHLRERERAFDRATAASTFLRLLLVALGGVVASIVGRSAIIAYLLSFAMTFAVLVVAEIPRITRQLRQRGTLSGGKSS